MDNKTQSFQFRKTKLALAVAMTVGLAACGVDGDEGSVSTSNAQTDASQPTQVEVSMPTGSIQGVVMDTNGMPIVGATVSTAGQTTTTDSSGSYLFDDVQVTNVAGADANTAHAPLILVVQAPDGYVSTATVTVTPNAQVDATNGNNNTNTGTSAGTSVGAPLTTFIDGFLAQADTAVLPKLESVISGVIRNQTTGEPIANAKLTLDFTGINVNTVTAPTPGTTPAVPNFTVSAESFSVMTNADGSFEFTGLANDSNYNLQIDGYDFENPGAPAATPGQVNNVSRVTTAEQVNNYLGDLNVTKHASADGISPYVTGVTGWIESSLLTLGQQYAALNRNIYNDFVIQFSEPLDASRFNADAVRVALDGSTYLTVSSAVLADDGKSVTVTLSEDVDPGAKISVFIPKADTVDLAGNYISVTANDGFTPAIDFDYETTDDKSQYVRVNFCTFEDVTLGGTGVATQVVDHISGQDASSATLAAYSNAFVDARDFDSTVDQVNGQTGTAEKLGLFKAIQNSSAPASVTDTTTADGTTVAFAILPTNVLAITGVTVNGVANSNYTWAGNTITFGVAPGNGQPVVVTYAVQTVDTDESSLLIDLQGASTATVTAASGSAFTANPTSRTSDGRVALSGVSHGERAVVTYTDGLGISVNTETITLTDQVKPTTVVQDSYDLHDYNNTGLYVATVTQNGQAQYGNGGETSNPLVSDIPGNPTLYVQPRHLAAKGTNSAAPTRGSEHAALTSGMSARAASGETQTTNVDSYSTLSVHKFDTGAGFRSNPLYDRTAFASWSVSQDIGVGFSENVSLLSTGAPTFTGSQTLTDFVAENDITRDVDTNFNVLRYNNGLNTATTEDLVIFTTPNVVELANDNNGGVLSFANAVADARGNAADADSAAQVVVLDAMPPYVTEAEWTGTDLVVTFNEPVSVGSTSRTLRVFNPTNSGASANVTVNSSTTTVSGNTLTIDLGTGATTVGALFADGTNNEFEYNDDADADLENHAVIEWDEIRDANGNYWDMFDDNNGTLDNRYEVFAPRFLAVNAVGTFTYSVQTSGYQDVTGGATGDTDGNVTFTITFTHPINLTSPHDVGAAAIDPTTWVAAGGALRTAGVTELANAIEFNTAGGDWSLAGTAATLNSLSSWSTANATHLNVINAIFAANDIGLVDAASDDNNAAAFVTTVGGEQQLTGSVVFSPDRRTITLNVAAGAVDGAIRFGTSDFLFQTEVDSNLVSGAKTTAGRFNWQNTN